MFIPFKSVNRQYLKRIEQKSNTNPTKISENGSNRFGKAGYKVYSLFVSINIKL
jgi:hypothetical protein